jgi:hypothetical protein
MINCLCVVLDSWVLVLVLAEADTQSTLHTLPPKSGFSPSPSLRKRMSDLATTKYQTGTIDKHDDDFFFSSLPFQPRLTHF